MTFNSSSKCLLILTAAMASATLGCGGSVTVSEDKNWTEATTEDPLLNDDAALRLTSSISISPTTVTSPVNSSQPLIACVSGFQAENFVTVSFPLTGDPAKHSHLSYSEKIGSSGGFCVSAPPSGRTLNLKPGSYEIHAHWTQSGSASDRIRRGPSAFFSVAAN